MVSLVFLLFNMFVLGAICGKLFVEHHITGTIKLNLLQSLLFLMVLCFTVYWFIIEVSTL